MENTAPALDLRDIHLPADPIMWPLAPGWWLLIVVFMIVAYLIVKKIVKIKKRKQLNDLIQQQLIIINNEYRSHQNKHQLAGDVSRLLKRFARHVLNDVYAVSLTGNKWIEYLNSKARSQVFNGFNMVLTQAQYTPNIDFDVSSLMATVKNYIPIAIKYMDKEIIKANSGRRSHA
ncbi:MAG: DUF4381 domain-containing protein [Alcanivoracaceae bacterium]|nr:DUF4381 domain-containing protein [Alcanivoracaceae bacterium]